MYISKFTLGTAQLGLAYGIANSTGMLTEEDAINLLEYAWDYTIRSFDTAPAYGESEKRIGKFIEKKKLNKTMDSFCLSTKISNHQEDLSKEEMLKEIREKVQKSLKDLNLNYTHLCLLHKTTDMNNQNLLDAMEKIKEEGLVRKIGVSIYTPQDVERFLDIGLFDAIQIPINIFDQRLIHSGLLNSLENKKVIIFARSAFLQGLFFFDGHNIPEKIKEADQYLIKLRKISDTYNIPVHELAILFLKSLPQITSILLGMETKEQIITNSKIFSKPGLQNEIMSVLLNEFKEVPEKIINPTMWK